MSTHDMALALIQDGTETTIRFDNSKVGVCGAKARGNDVIFVWNQRPLRFLSSDEETAYSMSVPLLEELREEHDVTHVYIADAGVQVNIEEFEMTGRFLDTEDERFNEQPEHDQRYVKVDSV